MDKKDADGQMHERLLKLIKAERNACEDRNGSTPLMIFAQKMKDFGPNSKEKKSLLWALGRILEDIDRLRHDQIFTLSQFLYFSKITKVEIDAYRSELRSALARIKQSHVAERAELMRFICIYTNYKFTMRELQKETAIKEKMTWHWIDIAIDSGYWVPALERVRAELKKGTGIMPLFARLPTWYMIRKDQLGLDIQNYISPNLNGSDHTKLQTWYYKITGTDIQSQNDAASIEFLKQICFNYN